MTEENKPKSLEDIALYQYANVGVRLGSHEDTHKYAIGALEKLASDFEKALGDKKDILSGFKKAALSSEEGVAIALNEYNPMYDKALDSLTVTQFYDLRLKNLKSILGDDKAEEAKTVFTKYGEKTVGSIRKAIIQAQAKIKDKTGLFDEKAKKEAEETMKKLSPIYSLIFDVCEEKNYDDLVPAAKKNAYVKLVKLATDALEHA